MKTLTTLLLTLLIALVAVPAYGDLTFHLTGTVAEPAVLHNDGASCSMTLTVQTVAGDQLKILSAYNRQTCERFSQLHEDQRVSARGSLFINDANNLVPLVEWIEATD